MLGVAGSNANLWRGGWRSFGEVDLTESRQMNAHRFVSRLKKDTVFVGGLACDLHTGLLPAALLGAAGILMGNRCNIFDRIN